LNELGEHHLKHYVYVLRDPRDGKVFYVGEGTTDRVLSHLNETLEAEDAKNSREHTSKTRRIAELWSSDEMVDWQIVSRGYETQEESEIAEAAVMAAISMSQNGALLNIQSGKHGSSRGAVPIDELRALAASPVNPSTAYKTVFVFPIHKALRDRADGDVYRATRGYWEVAAHWRNKKNAVAVGLVSGRSVGAFIVDDWSDSEIERKFEFSGRPISDDELNNSRWTQIINAARGYFQRGNWLVAEFDGSGKFRILRGSANKDWQPLI